jgi:hypothetical protein
MFFPHFVGELFGHAGISWAVRIGTFEELKSFHGVKSRSHAELIAEAEQAFAAARRISLAASASRVPPDMAGCST